MLRDVLNKGIADPCRNSAGPILGNDNQDMSLEEVFRFVESKEARKHFCMPFQMTVVIVIGNK